MFAAITAYPKFFKEHMQLFIAIAPVMYLNNMCGPLFLLLTKSKAGLEAAKKMGPEMMPDPGCVNVTMSNIMAALETS